MISSMTAFARQSVQQDWGMAIWELRTVNHRFLEADIRLPEQFREMEMILRDLAAKKLKRGKFDCYLKFKPREGEEGLRVNKDLVKQLAKAAEEIRQTWSHDITASLTHVLAWPGVLQVTELDQARIQQDILQAFDLALDEIVKIRQREGAATAQRIQDRAQEVMQEVQAINERLPIVLNNQRQKIMARIEEFKLTIDPLRLEEEILVLTQKMDIAEEVERLEIHINEVRETLNKEGAIGRRLDFLMQELHREANTLGSKSADAEISHSAIRLKVLIEQMREQVQNVE